VQVGAVKIIIPASATNIYDIYHYSLPCQPRGWLQHEFTDNVGKCKLNEHVNNNINHRMTTHDEFAIPSAACYNRYVFLQCHNSATFRTTVFEI